MLYQMFLAESTSCGEATGHPIIVPVRSTRSCTGIGPMITQGCCGGQGYTRAPPSGGNRETTPKLSAALPELLLL